MGSFWLLCTFRLSSGTSHLHRSWCCSVRRDFLTNPKSFLWNPYAWVKGNLRKVPQSWISGVSRLWDIYNPYEGWGVYEGDNVTHCCVKVWFMGRSFTPELWIQTGNKNGWFMFCRRKFADSLQLRFINQIWASLLLSINQSEVDICRTTECVLYGGTTPPPVSRW